MKKQQSSKWLYRWALLLLCIATLFTSCDLSGSYGDYGDGDEDEEVDENLLPDGTYKIVFWEGEEPVKVTFKNGKPEDPSLFYRDGYECTYLYPSKQMSAKMNTPYARQNGDMEFHRHSSNGLSKIKKGDKLWAWWEVREIYVETVIDGRTNSNYHTYYYGEPIVAYRSEREDAVFDGWFNSDFSIRYSDGDDWIFGYELITDVYPMEYSVIRLYGRYISAYVDAIFDYGDGRTEKLSVKRNEYLSPELLAQQVLEDRILTHWSLTPGGAPFNGVVTDDLTLYAVYVRYKTTTLHDGYGNTVTGYCMENGEVTYSGQFGIPGYSIAAWYTNPELTGTPVKTLSYGSLQEHYYAKWEKATYTLQFNCNGLATTLQPLTYSMGDLVMLPELTQPGYEFLGWCSDPELTSEAILMITPEMYGDVTLYPAFAARTYQITMSDPNGAFPNQTNLVVYENSYQLPVPTETGGRRFLGWMTAGGMLITNNEGMGLSEYLFAESIMVYPKYE